VPEPTRPWTAGKFVAVGAAKLWIRGTGWPRDLPTADPGDARTRATLSAVAGDGFNVVRLEGPVPPRAFLDLAWEHSLRIVVEADARSAAAAADGARRLAGHPALLCHAIDATEAPGGAARRSDGEIARAFAAIKRADPGALVACVRRAASLRASLPYLDLAWVRLEGDAGSDAAARVADLHAWAGDRPLLVEIEAPDDGPHPISPAALEAMVRAAFAEGSAGVCVPAPSRGAVRAAPPEIPLPRGFAFPRISVVVCVYNGQRTIGETLAGLQRLDYPDFEVLVVDDGSTDATASIVANHGVRAISTPNRGLGQARNTGWRAARGDIVAFIDDDAWPDPHWLQFIALRFASGDYGGVGGPNIAPPWDGVVPGCIAAVGGPSHVPLSARDAAHLAGVNMAFRRSALEAVDGFDPRFRAAGDDVDLCERLQARGVRLGFHAGAMCWHHPRGTLAAYWRQQVGYGRSQVALRYREVRRAARRAAAAPASLAARLKSLPLTPEWLALVALLGSLAALAPVVPALQPAVAAFALAVAGSVAHALRRAWNVHRHSGHALSAGQRAARIGLTALVELLQPLARLHGQLRERLPS
jgi:GT2 family glycosyltransferase